MICGYIRKKENIYSIVLGKPGKNGFVYKGHVTLGVPAAAVESLRRWPGQPFMAYPSGSGNESAVWVYPEKVCTVEYMPNTKNSLLLSVKLPSIHFLFFRQNKYGPSSKKSDVFSVRLFDAWAFFVLLYFFVTYNRQEPHRPKLCPCP